MMKNNSYWNVEYYHTVSHFFWEPQHLGLAKVAKEKRKSHEEVLANVSAKEVTLNGQLNIFFRLAPDALLGRLLTHVFGQEIADTFSLRTKDELRRNFLGKDPMQPDFLFAGEKTVAGIEMKIGTSKCSVPQVAKYLLANLFEEEATGERSTHCFVLLHKGDFSKCWKNKQPVGSLEVLREELLAYEFPDKTKKGHIDLVPRHERLEQLKRETLLGSLTYVELASFLEQERDALPAVEAAQSYRKLIDGMVNELQRAGMI